MMTFPPGNAGSKKSNGRRVCMRLYGMVMRKRRGEGWIPFMSEFLTKSHVRRRGVLAEMGASQAMRAAKRMVDTTFYQKPDKSGCPKNTIPFRYCRTGARSVKLPASQAAVNRS
jgi:hypothetical protein